jgi:hypothetical protein
MAGKKPQIRWWRCRSSISLKGIDPPGRGFLRIVFVQFVQNIGNKKWLVLMPGFAQIKAVNHFDARWSTGVSGPAVHHRLDKRQAGLIDKAVDVDILK